MARIGLRAVAAPVHAPHAAASLLGLLTLLVAGPAAASGEAPPRVISVPGGVLEVELDGRPPAGGPAELLAWVERSARAVADYYGTFPVARAHLRLGLRLGGGVGHGTARGGSVPRVDVQVGVDSSRAELDADWVLVHELVHLGFPSVERRHHWMEEGLATYVEPLARARAGLISREAAWVDLVDGLPKGLPGPGDEGLDATPTWGRTYWGGALFWFVADVELRRRSSGRVGLEDALRGIVGRGGTIGHLWSIGELLDAGDAATGRTVLRELYERMALAPRAPDLSSTWRHLGIARTRSGIAFEEGAPWSGIRDALTKRRP